MEVAYRMAERLRRGVPIDAATWERFQHISAETDVALPQP